LNLRYGSRRDLFVVCLMVLACFACQPAVRLPEALPPPRLERAAAAPTPSFDREVRPILERRCAVCHACYDAPCQLVLSSWEGAARGASKEVVYHASRLRVAAPTRLGIDARSVRAWRGKGFFPVLPETARAEDSVLLRMLALGAARPPLEGEPLAPEFPLDIDRTLSCPKRSEVAAYELEHPTGGMPYGTAPLTSAELRVLTAWASRGAEPPAPRSIPPSARVQVGEWESFLNDASAKRRLVARYLFEHWFVGHLYFRDLPTGPFFRIVRSRTAPGEPIDEIATRRPYDDPGAPFWYRLRPCGACSPHFVPA